MERRSCRRCCPRPEPDPAHWQEQLKAIVRATHHGLLEHRDLARAALADVPLGEGALALRERTIALMRLGGLPDRVVAYGCDLLALYAVSTAVEHAVHAGGHLERTSTAAG